MSTGDIERMCGACSGNNAPGIDPALGEEDPRQAIPFYVARDRCIFSPMDLRSVNRTGLAQEIAETCYYPEAEGGYELEGDPSESAPAAILGVWCGEVFMLGYCGMSRADFEASNEATLL